jgi:hypothetical protein
VTGGEAWALGGRRLGPSAQGGRPTGSAEGGAQTVQKGGGSLLRPQSPGQNARDAP